MRKGLEKAGTSAVLAGLLAMALAATLVGCESIRITGGTSEVGNPVSAHRERSSADSAGSKVTGIGISATGMPIRLVREAGKTEEPQGAAAPGQDSLPTQ